ncbi:MAG: DUF302 domain-containing protein [Planctomycetes bacterium]|nr:DUF302 domain-containing protein [Planctomycetota bacterium]NOG54049.1 DUF302 domain-containing protein [Planctomycetota bacterium]
MIYSKTTSNGTVSDVCGRVEQASLDNKFGVLGRHNLREKMQEKGVAFDRDCIVLEVCNPHVASQALGVHMGVSTLLPCRISVYQEKQGSQTVHVSTMKPCALLGLMTMPGLDTFASEVEAALVKIIDEACEG